MHGLTQKPHLRKQIKQVQFAGVAQILRCAVLSCSAVSDSVLPHGLQPTRLLCPWDSPRKKTRVSCHALLQGIFPNQGWNPGLPHCRQILYHLSHQGSPRILEWVAYSLSRGSSRPRNQTGVSHIAGGFLSAGLPRKPHFYIRHSPADFFNH